jgi:hypothetical protein
VPASGTIALRNVGAVPLAYISEQMGWIAGVQYTPGVPTSQQGEQVGVLAPGEVVNLTHDGALVGLVGASKPFSIYDGGYATADETTAAWPLGVEGSEGSSTMYIAVISADAVCSPVIHPY